MTKGQLLYVCISRSYFHYCVKFSKKMWKTLINLAASQTPSLLLSKERQCEAKWAFRSGKGKTKLPVVFLNWYYHNQPH